MVDDVRAAAALARASRLRLGAGADPRRAGCRRRPAAPATELRLRGERHTLGARPARRPPPLRRRQRLLRAVPRSIDDLQLRATSTRGATTLEEAQEAKLELVCTKLALPSRRARARRRLRLGKLRDPRRDAPRGQRASGITLSEPQARTGPRARRRGRRRGPRRVPRRRLPRADRRAVRRDRRASAWSSTWGRSGSTSTPPSSRELLGPGGRLLNHGIAKLKDFDTPDEGAVLGALRVPRRRSAAALAGDAGTRARRAS